MQVYVSHICNFPCLLISSLLLKLCSASLVKTQVQATRFCWCYQETMVFSSAEDRWQSVSFANPGICLFASECFWHCSHQWQHCLSAGFVTLRAVNWELVGKYLKENKTELINYFIFWLALLILPNPVNLNHCKDGRKSHSSILLIHTCRAILGNALTNPDLNSPEQLTKLLSTAKTTPDL